MRRITDLSRSRPIRCSPSGHSWDCDMPIALQIVLALSPLAIYFLILGAWQSGRDPQVVPGMLDYGLLAFGVGGLIAFGPIGSGLIRVLFPGESVWAWLASPTLFTLVALLRAPSAHKRVVV